MASYAEINADVERLKKGGTAQEFNAFRAKLAKTIEGNGYPVDFVMDRYFGKAWRTATRDKSARTNAILAGGSSKKRGGGKSGGR